MIQRVLLACDRMDFNDKALYICPEQREMLDAIRNMFRNKQISEHLLPGSTQTNS